MNCRHGPWAWLGVAALLAFAPAGPPALAAATPADQALSPALRAKLAQLISKAGHDREIPGPIAGALGLTPAGAPWPDRQFAFQWNGAGAFHAVAVGRGAGQDIVLTVRGPAAVSVFRARADGKLDRGVNLFLQTNQTMPMFPAEAQAEFAAELSFWAANIDAVMDQN